MSTACSHGECTLRRAPIERCETVVWGEKVGISAADKDEQLGDRPIIQPQCERRDRDVERILHLSILYYLSPATAEADANPTSLLGQFPYFLFQSSPFRYYGQDYEAKTFKIKR